MLSNAQHASMQLSGELKSGRVRGDSPHQHKQPTNKYKYVPFTQNMCKRCMNFWEVFTINSRENIGDIDSHVNLAMLFQN